MRIKKPNVYGKEFIRHIAAVAKNAYPGSKIRWIKPMAYCVATDSKFVAIFVLPPCDHSEMIKHFVTIVGQSASKARSGQWHWLAYVENRAGGDYQIVS